MKNSLCDLQGYIEIFFENNLTKSSQTLCQIDQVQSYGVDLEEVFGNFTIFY